MIIIIIIIIIKRRIKQLTSSSSVGFLRRFYCRWRLQRWKDLDEGGDRRIHIHMMSNSSTAIPRVCARC
jgi:hypothetical protein